MDDALAFLGGRWARGVLDITSDISALDSSGRWAVVLPYDGSTTCVRFDNWSTRRPAAAKVGRWVGPQSADWASSIDEAAYEDAVRLTRQRIAEGDVYQANICRIMSAPLPDVGATDVSGLYSLLRNGNPAPHGGFIRVPSLGIALASASPELFLERSGDDLKSGPIKGTGKTPGDLLAKDEAENIMIVDLMRNDFSRICRTGSVAVPSLLRVEHHPGLVHLVSDVTGELSPDVGWKGIYDATFPPGSVTGAPKSSALRLIDALESTPRGPYCGAFGWVDADARTASLGVTIRTFWTEGDILKFGTGAGITWGSDPAAEWRETQLKAERLISLASGVWQGDAS